MACADAYPDGKSAGSRCSALGVDIGDGIPG
jgi:hypothetical protein